MEKEISCNCYHCYPPALRLNHHLCCYNTTFLSTMSKMPVPVIFRPWITFGTIYYNWLSQNALPSKGSPSYAKVTASFKKAFWGIAYLWYFRALVPFLPVPACCRWAYLTKMQYSGITNSPISSTATGFFFALARQYIDLSSRTT